jgi:hypothetical protein
MFENLIGREIDDYTRDPVPVWEVRDFIEITNKFMPR